MRSTLLSTTALISMSASAASITGSATYLERIALPPDATFEAVVEDVSRMDAPAQVIGRVSFMPAGQVPIKFEVPYVESQVQQNHRYNVRARILQDGQLIYTTTQAHPVLTQGGGTTADMMVMKRMTPPAARSDRPLTDTQWRLVELHGGPVKKVGEQPPPSLLLQSDGQRLTGSGGCNRMTGSYQLNGQSITFGKVASTMMACVDGMEQETAFFKALDQTRAWKVQGDALELLDASATTIARFVAADPK